MQVVAATNHHGGGNPAASLATAATVAANPGTNFSNYVANASKVVPGQAAVNFNVYQHI